MTTQMALSAQTADGRSLRDVATVRSLTRSQEAAIRATVRLFARDDVAHGISANARMYCDACERPRPAAGSIHYERYVLCNGCAVEYEVAQARGTLASVGQYVRDKRFGDGERHAVAT
jgi:hypothetical protein